MKIIGLQVENFLNLRAVSLATDGSMIRVTGKNGAGKSALFNAIFCALAGKSYHPAEPIRKGQKKAHVRVLLGDTEVELVVILRITENDAYLDVESPEGARFRAPQKMLDALIGRLTFDPSEFSRMPAAKRLEVLRGLVKLDVDIDEIDRNYERDFQFRTEWNRKVNSGKDRVAMLANLVNPAMDVTPIDVSALTQQMVDASERNSSIDNAITDRQTQDYSLTLQHSDRAKLAEEIETLRARLLETDERIAQTEALIARREPIAERIDVSALREETTRALSVNAARDNERRQRDALALAEEDLATAQQISDKLTASLSGYLDTKEAAIARAEMPIEGLGFGDGDVTYRGLPFAQESTGNQLRIAAAIGMAANPKLRVMFVRDANLLDSDGRKILGDIAVERGYQWWMEFTQDEATTGIHFVDGAVAAIDGVAVEQDEAEQAAVV
jgi:energy-coupling factor transporter ATP-binding protein EcfA2